MLARLGNENAQERVFLQNTRQIYSRALEQTRSRPWLGKEAGSSGETTAAQPQTEAQSRYDQELENSIAEMTEAYENGELDEDTYNAIVENLRQGTEERKNVGRKYSVSDSVQTQTAGTEQRYANISLAEDGSVYTYDFLTSLPDMNTVTVVNVSDIRDASGKIDTAKVIALGKKNALSVGTERDGEIYVKNRYTGRELTVTTASIRHGLNGAMNRLLTNARLGSVIGELVQNAVPINALHNKAAIAEGTYAMAGYAVDSGGREFVAIITVEQRSGNIEGIDVFDVTHAVSGRQKREGVPVDTKSQGINLSTHASKISISEFLPIVNDS